MAKDSFIFWGLCAIIFLIPLPFGGNEEWAIFAFEALTIVLFGIHVAGRTFRHGSPEAGSAAGRERFPAVFKVFLAVFFVISVFQLIPLPLPLLKILSPHAARIYEGTSGLGLGSSSASKFHPLSFSVSLSMVDLAKYVCFCLFGYLAYRYVATKKRIEILVEIILIAAFCQALYGLAEYFSGSGRIFGWKNIYNPGSAFGTFVNRNHFSGFLEMCLPLSIGYLLIKTGIFWRGDFSLEKKAPPGRKRLPRTILLGALPVMLGIGIFYSRSRSGIISFLASIFFMFIVLFLNNRQRQDGFVGKNKFMRIVAVITLCIFTIALLIGTRPILERFSRGEMNKTGRTEFAADTLNLIKDYLIFGSGLGTFVYSYKMYEKDYGNGGVLKHAHNDYLEVLAESGLFGGGSLILLSLCGFGHMFVKLIKRHELFIMGVGLGCLTGIFAILVHSLTDFNLRIPANAVYFIAFYAMGLRTLFLDREVYPGNSSA
jgi:O-antigen ligase